MRSIRPTGNELPGYEPSYAMGRVLEEIVSG
jgi:RNA ligase